MRWLIAITQGVRKAQIVQFWYGILDKELQWKVCDVTLMNDDSLACLFCLKR
jgi:hypothetical protein